MWIRLKYYDMNGKVVGHVAWCRNNQEAAKILERHGIAIERIVECLVNNEVQEPGVLIPSVASSN